MRITCDLLFKTARDTAAERARRDRDIVCIYLTGSLLHETPMLGGAADIDLVIIHAGEPAVEREVLPVTNEVSLDIQHHSQLRYQSPRQLRLDAWVGSTLTENFQALYAVQHWFEFTQAGVSAQFYSPENILARARPFADSARKHWLALGSQKDSLAFVRGYLSALENSGNAIACLTGAPLPERRFFLDLPERAEQLGQPDLIGGLVNLLMGDYPTGEQTAAWIEGWEKSFDQFSEQPPLTKYSRFRKAYYLNAVSVLQEEQLPAALWLLMSTWSEMAVTDPKSPNSEACAKAAADLSIIPARLKEMDEWLDSVDVVLEDWARNNGL